MGVGWGGEYNKEKEVNPQGRRVESRAQDWSPGTKEMENTTGEEAAESGSKVNCLHTGKLLT